MSKLLSINEFYCIIGSLIVCFLLSTNVFSEDQIQKIKGPIIITSEMLTADNKAHTALFEHSVIARTTDMTIYADRMLVHYDEDTGDVNQIDAEGKVKVIKENRAITSPKAIYYAEEEKVIFTGDPRAVEGENVVTGKKMTYLIDEDRFLVEGSKVFLTQKKKQ